MEYIPRFILPWQSENWESVQDVLNNTTVNNEDDIDIIIFKIYDEHNAKLGSILKKIFDCPNPVISREKFFNVIFPYIKRNILDMEKKFKNTYIDLLLSQNTQFICIPRTEVLGLISGAFLSIYDSYNYTMCESEYVFGKFSFEYLYKNELIEPIKCLLHYFDVCYSRELKGRIDGNILIHRVSMNRIPKWKDLDVKFCRVFASNMGTIDEALTNEFVNFSDTIIGSEDFGNYDTFRQSFDMIIGRPETLIARLICCKMESNEAISVIGSEKFSIFENGKMIDTYQDTTDKINGTIISRIIFLDSSKNIEQQYTVNFSRDLNKAFSGFYTDSQAITSPIATGLWGNEFEGIDQEIKALQQILAAAFAHRELLYFVNGDRQLADKINNFSDFLILNNKTIKEVLIAYEALKKENKTNLSSWRNVLSRLKEKI